MKKALLINDSRHFSEGSFEFLRQMNDREPLLVTGIFLPQSTFAGVLSYAAAANGLGTTGYFPSVEPDEEADIEMEIKRFEERCIKNGINFRIHEDTRQITLPLLRLESRFADIMIISGDLFYHRSGMTEPPLEYIREVIRASECPVLIVPEKYAFPEKVILAYDGSEESVYTIKQFTYLFPELADKPVMLVYADEKKENPIPYESYIEELAARHFSDLTLTKLDLDPKNQFEDWIKDRNDNILICGSLGRSALSHFFKKGFAAGVIRKKELPVFVAHRS
jgi:hypothetical protein